MTSKDVIDHTVLSERAARRYYEFANKVSELLADANLTNEQIQLISDEQAIPQPDGSLEIIVKIPSHSTVRFTVPKQEWRYINSPS